MTELTAEETDLLAHLEHRRWLIERQLLGYAPWCERSEAKRLNPLLVEWAKLPETERTATERNHRLCPRCSRAPAVLRRGILFALWRLARRSFDAMMKPRAHGATIQCRRKLKSIVRRTHHRRTGDQSFKREPVAHASKIRWRSCASSSEHAERSKILLARPTRLDASCLRGSGNGREAER